MRGTGPGPGDRNRQAERGEERRERETGNEHERARASGSGAWKVSRAEPGAAARGATDSVGSPADQTTDTAARG